MPPVPSPTPTHNESASAQSSHHKTLPSASFSPGKQRVHKAHFRGIPRSRAENHSESPRRAARRTRPRSPRPAHTANLPPPRNSFGGRGPPPPPGAPSVSTPPSGGDAPGASGPRIRSSSAALGNHGRLWPVVYFELPRGGRARSASSLNQRGSPRTKPEQQSVEPSTAANAHVGWHGRGRATPTGQQPPVFGHLTQLIIEWPWLPPAQAERRLKARGGQR